MSNRTKVTNIVIAGLGGQGVLKASDIVADVAFRAGLDVKKSEIHGMSQRGGSVTSDVRFGERVYSPMVPPGEADYLVVLSPDQVETNRWQLREGGTLITPAAIPEGALRDKRSLNVALLGWLKRAACPSLNRAGGGSPPEPGAEAARHESFRPWPCGRRTQPNTEP